VVARWDRSLEGEAPEDWAAWFADFLEIERLLHGAAQGTVDQEFYARVGRFLDRTGAPPSVRDAIAFQHGLAGWDFPTVRDAGVRLVRAEPVGLPLTRRAVLEGLVTAYLVLGDTAAADSAFATLAAQARPAEVDLRLLLLGAHVRRSPSSGG